MGTRRGDYEPTVFDTFTRKSIKMFRRIMLKKPKDFKVERWITSNPKNTWFRLVTKGKNSRPMKESDIKLQFQRK